MASISVFDQINAFYGKLGKNERILFFAALGCVGLLLLDRLVLGPILSEMKVLDGELETRSLSIAKSQRILSFKDSILTGYSEVSSYFDSGEKTQQEIIADLLKKIETLAQQKSISIASIKTGEMEDRVVLQEYRTNIDCEGKLSDVFDFMNALEQSDYLFQIIQYSLVPKSKGSDIVKCTMTVSRMLIAAEKLDEVAVAGESKEAKDAREVRMAKREKVSTAAKKAKVAKEARDAQKADEASAADAANAVSKEMDANEE